MDTRSRFDISVFSFDPFLFSFIVLVIREFNIFEHELSHREGQVLLAIIYLLLFQLSEFWQRVVTFRSSLIIVSQSLHLFAFATQADGRNCS